MGYKESLEAAEAVVLNYEEFGSYQGDWLAFVEYKGERGIIMGSYGSCSECDAFEAEFGYSGEPEERDGKFYKSRYDYEECTEEEYKESVRAYKERFVEFGRSYLEASGRPDLIGREYFERMLSELKEDDWFDKEKKEYCEWALNQNWEQPQQNNNT